MSNSAPAFLAKGDEGRTMTLLAEDFEPGHNDVICGRGRRCYNHIGNERFRRLVESYLDRYSNAGTKLEKSYILSDIVMHIRKLSPKGGFVKKGPDTDRWSEVGDFLAREKTSQAFRDALHEKYKSSNVSKKKRRQAEQANKLQAQPPFEAISEDSLSEADLQFALSNFHFMRTQPYANMDNDVLAANEKIISMENSARSVMDLASISKYNPNTALALFNRSCPNLGQVNTSSLASTLPNRNPSGHNYEWGSHSSPSLFAGLATPSFTEPSLPDQAFVRSKPERRLTPNELAIEAMIERPLDTDLEEEADLSTGKQEPIHQPLGSSNQMSVETMLETSLEAATQKSSHLDVNMQEPIAEEPVGSSSGMTIEAMIQRSLDADLEENADLSKGKQEEPLHRPLGSSNQMFVDAMLETSLEAATQKPSHLDVNMQEPIMEEAVGSSSGMTIEAMIQRSLEADLREDTHFSAGKQKSTFQQPSGSPMQVIAEAPGSMEEMSLSPVAEEDSQGLFDSLMKLAERNVSVAHDDNPFEPNPLPERRTDRQQVDDRKRGAN